MERRPKSAIAILQLMRLPNAFTAVADVMMGFLLTREGVQPAGIFVLLVAASCQLYLAGMVLNDVFDIDVDRRERPDRPIPSGRVNLRFAQTLGWSLLFGGVTFGWLVTALTGDIRAGVVASALAVCVVLYDKVLKKTPLAPFFMGACRSLNALLGMSAAPFAWGEREWLVAAALGIYIVGVTIFARTEARDTSRARLALGTIVLLAGVFGIVVLPHLLRDPNQFGLIVSFQLWYLYWAIAAAMVGWRCFAAIASPTKPAVQSAVRNAVQSIIVLDAGVCLGFVAPFWGVVIVLLLLPTGVLTQWLKST
jgi:4-hydroxybenzoate polyprenyltransferase